MTRSTLLVSLPLTIGLVCSLNTFPKQLHIGRETHQTFIATGISIHCIKVLHVWLPCICKHLLLLLDLQLLGQFQQYIVNQLIVCQLVLRTDPDAAEDLIIDVSIQCLHQFRSRQSCIHLQECQCHLAFRGEEGLSASFSPYALRLLLCQPKRYRHFSKRRSDWMRPS